MILAEDDRGLTALEPDVHRSRHIHHGRGDLEGEHSILDRFSRQDHATNAVTAPLMERLKVLKKTKR